jgi:hypothetical protein
MGKFTDIDQIIRLGLRKMSSKESMKILGDDSRKLIKRRTRLGGGVERSLGPRTKLDKLSTKYKKQRKKMKGLSSFTRPSKSNLTLTSDMLDHIGVNARRAGVSLKFTKKFAKDKAKWVQDAGRNFFHLSKPEFKQLRIKLEKRVQKFLNKLK